MLFFWLKVAALRDLVHKVVALEHPIDRAVAVAQHRYDPLNRKLFGFDHLRNPRRFGMGVPRLGRGDVAHAQVGENGLFLIVWFKYEGWDGIDRRLTVWSCQRGLNCAFRRS